MYVRRDGMDQDQRNSQGRWHGFGDDQKVWEGEVSEHDHQVYHVAHRRAARDETSRDPAGLSGFTGGALLRFAHRPAAR